MADPAPVVVDGGVARHGTQQEEEVKAALRSSREAPTASGPPGPDAWDAEVADATLRQFIKDGYFEERVDGGSTKRIGVIYKHLCVKGLGATAAFAKTLPAAIIGTFGPDLYRFIGRFVPLVTFDRSAATRTLLHDFNGVVRGGEMLLVLGRPGSGCSTFLKTLANERKHFEAITGEVTYGDLSAKKQETNYRGEVNYLPEEDVHLPALTVWQTVTFALMNKTKARHRQSIGVVAEALLRLYGIYDTHSTPVGNELVPGVSGGERKRVSIAEILATKSSILCWDNSTRGLDASTALEFIRSLRVITDTSSKATILTLYQASEGIYAEMDKVIVIDSGRCIFQGPARDAKQYFVDLGFYCPPSQTTADFLTACTDPLARRFRDGVADQVPKTAEELEMAFKKSAHYQHVMSEIEDYQQDLRRDDSACTKEFEQSVQRAKSHSTVSKGSSYTVSYLQQVRNCFRRECWLLLGDKPETYTKLFVTVTVGLIIGSLFYGELSDSSGAYSRGGALFMSVLFLCWLQLGELMKVITGRDVIARHRAYALYRPSAVTIARVLIDVVVIPPQVCLFTVIMYFMCGLDLDAGKFWTYWIFIYFTTLAITSLYRMFASLSPRIDDSVRFSGVALNLLIIYGGYVIPKPQLIGQYIWFGWINLLNPLAYAFEAVTLNEFSNRDIPCNPSQLIPQQVTGGPPVDSAHQACLLPGTLPGSTSVSASVYLDSTYGFQAAHLWRNLGVLAALAVLYISVTALSTEIFDFARDGSGAPVFARTKRSKQMLQSKTKVRPGDIEEGEQEERSISSRRTEGSSKSEQRAITRITHGEQVLTWEDVNFSVPTPLGPKQLLHGVDGFCKPGVLIALMGVSGAGKTTLLNTISQRQPMGVVSGEILVDGRPPDAAFQRSTGFCEQMDLHDGTATIRESLEFSALLRQDLSTPRAEKLAYVDTIIDLLELSEIQDALVNCLSLEQRKRLTIGVELAAKPSLLLFLDEPTSGLDSQSAYSIVHILRKLASAGQAILCTIHQPSSVLVQQFDMILALNPGGNTFYFGPIGDSGRDVASYFAQRGFECPQKKNIAEFLLETAAKKRRPDGTPVDWNEEWRNSDNAKAIKAEIRAIKDVRSKVTTSTTTEIEAFAASQMIQTIEVTKRLFRQYWRDPSYLYGKLFTATIMGIFNGFTFFRLGNSVVDMQNRMFSAFIIVTIPATVVNTVVPKFFQNMMLWLAREHPSRVYGWFAFSTAQIVAEVPITILSSVLYYLLWYWPAFGFQAQDVARSTSGYVFFMTMLFYLFMASWGQWITAFAPSFTVLSNILPIFFIMVALFNGVVRPYALLPAFWRYTMYYVNPSQWWINGVLAAALHNLPVHCAESEMVHFRPPRGLTCGEYAAAFAAQSGGNLTNPSATDLCSYCPLTSGDQYLAQLSVSADDKWRNLGIFLAFVVSNYTLVYFFIWSVRVKGWGFGIGYLFGFFGRILGLLVLPFSKLVSLRKHGSQKTEPS